MHEAPRRRGRSTAGTPEIGPLPDPLVVTALRRRLLEWYALHRRQLPWRDQRDPWAVWVSEMMLQQTRVATVLPHFQRWMERFPDIRSLADAPLDDVLHAWQGLGYYQRARNLHRAAIVVRDLHGGELPDDPDTLRALPGIGPYTAGAIASIAFGRPVPLVDGNVARVLSRLATLDAPIDAPAARRAHWRIAAALVDPQAPGDFNQALMELGATVCTPRTPDCARCPVRDLCRACAVGEPTAWPRPAARPASVRTESRWALHLTTPDGALLVARRPDHGLLAGLWEIPLMPDSWEPGQPPPGLAEPERIGPHAHRPLVTHVFTHLRLIVSPLTASVDTALAGCPAGYVDAAWVAPSARDRLAFSALHLRVARACSAAGNG